MKSHNDNSDNGTIYFTRNSTSYSPQRGDLIYYSWSSGSTINHVGIVYNVDADYVYTVEGNTSNGATTKEYGGVYKRKQSKTNSQIVGYTRIAF